MKLYTCKSAMAAFYYLMAIDEKVSADELAKFHEIGQELDPEAFPSYKDNLIVECEKYIQVAKDDEYYDVVLECVDKALLGQDNDTALIPSRLLVWNMLVVAFSNREYANAERRLIKHVVRLTETDESAFLQMEELLKAGMAIESELNWVKASDRPYSKVAPIVEELTHRLDHILLCAKELIDDEVDAPSIQAVEIKADMMDKLKAEIVSDSKMIAKDVKNTYREIKDSISSGLKKHREKRLEKLESKLGRSNQGLENGSMYLDTNPPEKGEE